MSSTNKTTNLELSQFLGSDSPKWLTDYNADMEKIDAGYQTVKAQADATDLIVGGHTSSISTLQDTTTNQGTAITQLRTDVSGNSGSINTINSLIGNGEPTTTDKTIIGAINEINAEAQNLTSRVGSVEKIFTSEVEIASVSANGVKTIAELLDDLHASLSTFVSTLTSSQRLLITHLNISADNVGYTVAPINHTCFTNGSTVSSMLFSSNVCGISDLGSQSVRLASSGSRALKVLTDGNGTTLNINTSTVPTSGTVKIYGVKNF